jgi:uncharacterized protein (TIGR02646 family)
MVRIKKKEAPEILKKQGEAETAALCKQFDEAKVSERTKAKFFSFKSSIYAHEAVKTALETTQNHKCAFCETDIVRFYGDVEHFRPKAAWKQEQSDKLHYPGYYWLAYDWRNLFLSCQFCNQKFKKNLFPLLDNAQRATSYKTNISQESPLLIHPEDDVPEKLIGFRLSEADSIAYPIAGNAKAEMTIKFFGFNTDAKLRKARREHLNTVSVLARTRQLFLQKSTLSTEEKELVKEITLNLALHRKGKYSSMVKTLLKEFGE